MQLITWNEVNRKRRTDLPFSSPDYVRGYDLDMADFTALVGKFNSNTLDRAEENRLGDHVLTMIRIVLENPKVSPVSGDEQDVITDAMFDAGWGSLKYIKPGHRPYSYIYRSMFMASWGRYKKLLSEKRHAKRIDEHLQACLEDYKAEWSCGRVRTENFD